MPNSEGKRLLRRKDEKIIIHFDYDAFYCSVIEAENPALRSVPFAVQQKQIIVTANYEARRRGLRKLQLVTEAKQVCPELVIVLGEDLTRFRDASKALYSILRRFSWNDKVERLGFDEVWMDVSDIVEYNVEVLNKYDLKNSFFVLSKEDPTDGFPYDASHLAGRSYPAEQPSMQLSDHDELLLRRLTVASYFALHLRHQLEERMGYTSTVGISTSKLLSKLAGNVKKPKAQTTLLPPYEAEDDIISGNIFPFLDTHEIGRIPYIGFKVAHKLRGLVLGRPAEIEPGLVYGVTADPITVGRLRQIPELSPEKLESLLGGPGMPQGIGARIFQLIHGVDNSEVANARDVPRQISIEDSYLKLDTQEQVFGELHQLTKKLIERMRVDLVDDDASENDGAKWMAHPSTLRLSTRPRPPADADGKRSRSFNRISRSTALPRFVFSPSATADELAQRLLRESLVPLFKKLHPERSGWNLSLINVAVTGMDEKQRGADIDSLFRRQEHAARGVDEPHVENDVHQDQYHHAEEQEEEEGDAGEDWEASDEEDLSSSTFACPSCGHAVPSFAKAAHERFHALGS